MPSWYGNLKDLNIRKFINHSGPSLMLGNLYPGEQTQKQIAKGCRCCSGRLRWAWHIQLRRALMQHPINPFSLENLKYRVGARWWAYAVLRSKTVQIHVALRSLAAEYGRYDSAKSGSLVGSTWTADVSSCKQLILGNKAHSINCSSSSFSLLVKMNRKVCSNAERVIWQWVSIGFWLTT